MQNFMSPFWRESLTGFIHSLSTILFLSTKDEIYVVLWTEFCLLLYPFLLLLIADLHGVCIIMTQ